MEMVISQSIYIHVCVVCMCVGVGVCGERMCLTYLMSSANVDVHRPCGKNQHEPGIFA